MFTIKHYGGYYTMLDISNDPSIYIEHNYQLNENQYISEHIDLNINTWNQGSFVYINAPTGSGKTSFILDKILPFAKHNNRKILYICNRSALKEQIKLNILERFNNAIINYNENYNAYNLTQCLLLHFFITDNILSNFSIQDYTFYPELNKNLHNFKTLTDKKLTYVDLLKLYYRNPFNSLEDMEYYHLESLYNTMYPSPQIIYAEEKTKPSLEELQKNLLNGIKNSDIKTYDNITVMSYQELEYILKNNKNSLYDEHYVIFDEAHYLLEDSAFNNNTAFIQKYLFKSFPLATFIFISATLDEVKNYIESYCHNDIITTVAMPSVKENLFTPELRIDTLRTHTYVYNFTKPYSYLNTFYFNEIEEISKKIINDNSSDKWVLFVNSIKTGEKILNKLHENEITANFLTSDSKNQNREIFDYIIEKEKFDFKVLISTSVLDNGINLKDSLIKHIMIETCNKTSFIQMLGRIRRENVTGKLNLYIKNYTKKMFSGYINLNTKPILDIAFFSTGENLSIDDIYNNFICSSYGPANKVSMFYVENRILSINMLFIHKIYNLHNFYILMKNKLETQKSAYIHEVLSWLSLENTYNEANWLNYDDNFSDKKTNFLPSINNKNQDHETNPNYELQNINIPNIETSGFSELEVFLKQEVNKNFNKDDQHTFSAKFKEIIINHKLDNSFRKDRNIGIKKLNDFLKSNNFNYIITSFQKKLDSKKITFWTLKKIN